MKYKKFISMMVVISLIITGLVINKFAFAVEQVTVSVSNSSGNVGDEVSVNVSLSNVPSKGLSSGTIVIEYDQSKLDFVKLVGGEIVFDKDKDISGEVINVSQFYQSDYISGNPDKIQRGLQIFYTDFNQTGDSYIKKNGVLCELTFRIRSEFSSGETVLKPNNQDIKIAGSTDVVPFYSDLIEVVQANYNSGKIKVPKELGASPTPTFTLVVTQTPGSTSVAASATPSLAVTSSANPSQTSVNNRINPVEEKKPQFVVDMRLGEPDVAVNGKTRMINANNKKIAPTFGENGAVLPANEVSQIFGYLCEWNAIEKKIKIFGKGRVTEMWIGKKKLIVNGKAKVLNEGPELIDNKPYLPLCLASIAFECIIEWDKPSDTLRLKKY